MRCERKMQECSKMDKESRKTCMVDGVPMRGMELQEIARISPEALTKLKDEGKIIQLSLIHI